MRNSYLALLGFGLTQSTLAVFPFEFSAGNSTDFSGNYTGDGDVLAVDPTQNPVSQVVVDDFSNGTGSLITNVSGSRVNNDLGLDFSVSVSGGAGATADLLFANSSNNDGGANLFNSVGISGFEGGATSVTLRVDYNQFVAGRTEAVTNFISRPFLGALGLVNAGGLELDDFNTTFSLINPMFSSTGNMADFVSGVGSAVALGAMGFDNGVLTNFGTNGDAFALPTGATTFTSSAFTGLVPSNGGSDPDFLLIRGFDNDGDGFDATDAEQFVASGFEFTITADAGTTFGANTQFVISLDGEQFASTPALIPEPSVWGLLMMVLSGCLFARRRR